MNMPMSGKGISCAASAIAEELAEDGGGLSGKIVDYTLRHGEGVVCLEPVQLPGGEEVAGVAAGKARVDEDADVVAVDDDGLQLGVHVPGLVVHRRLERDDEWPLLPFAKALAAAPGARRLDHHRAG